MPCQINTRFEIFFGLVGLSLIFINGLMLSSAESRIEAKIEAVIERVRCRCEVVAAKVEATGGAFHFHEGQPSALQERIRQDRLKAKGQESDVTGMR